MLTLFLFFFLMRTWKTASPALQRLPPFCFLKEMFLTHSMCKEGDSPMCKEGGPPVRKFCPTHLPAPRARPITWRSSCFLHLSSVPGLWDTGACRNPWLSELVDIRPCQGLHSLSAVGRIEPFCRDKIVMNLSSLWLSSKKAKAEAGLAAWRLGL